MAYYLGAERNQNVVASYRRCQQYLHERKKEFPPGAFALGIIPLAAAVGLGRNAFKAMYLLAQAYFEVGEKRTALKYVERALAMKPDFKSARELKDSIDAA